MDPSRPGRRPRQAAAVGWLARTYARLLRGEVREVGGLWVCTGLPRRAYPRGGVTFGTAYLTGNQPFMVSAERLRHELVHVQQWRELGVTMAWHYLRAGRNPLTNRFEVEAGLRDGGYLPR